MIRQAVDLKDYVQVGYVARAHGIKGEVKISSTCGMDAKDFLDCEIILEAAKGSLSRNLIKRARPQNKYIIATLQDIDSRDESEALVGSSVWMRESLIPKLAEGELYNFQYVGLKVFTEEGIELGEVEDIFSTGANDVLVVTGKGQEYLIPQIVDVIRKIDIEAGVIVISPLPGLLEMNS